MSTQDVHDSSDGHHVESPPQGPPITSEETDGHHEGLTDDHHTSTADDHHDATVEAESHDHAAHADGTWATNDAERFYAWLGKFHPAATNFPIALLLAAFFADVLFVIFGTVGLRHAARFCLWGGGLMAVATAALGWGFVGFTFAEDDAILSAHRWNGTALAGLAIPAIWLGERAFQGRGVVAFRTTLVLVAAMAAYNGYLGGKMVYGEGHYNYPSPDTH